MSTGHQPKGPPIDPDKMKPPQSGSGVKPPKGWTPNPGGSAVSQPDLRCPFVSEFLTEHPLESVHPWPRPRPTKRPEPYGEIPPPSEGGPPFTLAEIDESIRLMEARLESGHGTKVELIAIAVEQADLIDGLRRQIRWSQSQIEKWRDLHRTTNRKRRAAAKRAAQAEAEAERLRAEVARLLQRTWDEHQFDGKPACTCHDCRTYARNSGLWAEVTDERGRVVDFRPAVAEKENHSE